MYWLLLPLHADAERHSGDEPCPSTGFWARLLRATWQRIRHPMGTGLGGS